jgi:Zn-dependent alcohol dehydrogenase
MKAAVVDAVGAGFKIAEVDQARRFGATDVINSATVNAVEAVRELLPDGVDSAFDFVGLNEVTTQTLEMLTVGGALYLIGAAGLDQIESGYQKLADPEITRVVITRF